MKTQKCNACNGTGKTIDHRQYGEAMRNRRLAKKIKLVDHAKKMGISQPYLCDLERGNRNWTAYVIGLYEEALA